MALGVHRAGLLHRRVGQVIQHFRAVLRIFGGPGPQSQEEQGHGLVRRIQLVLDDVLVAGGDGGEGVGVLLHRDLLGAAVLLGDVGGDFLHRQFGFGLRIGGSLTADHLGRPDSILAGSLHVGQQTHPVVAEEPPVPPLVLIEQAVAVAVIAGQRDQHLFEAGVRQFSVGGFEGIVDTLPHRDGDGLGGSVIILRRGAVEVGVSDEAVFFILHHPVPEEIGPELVLREFFAQFMPLGIGLPGIRGGVGQIVQHLVAVGLVRRGPGPQGQEEQGHGLVRGIQFVLDDILIAGGHGGEGEAVLLHRGVKDDGVARIVHSCGLGGHVPDLDLRLRLRIGRVFRTLIGGGHQNIAPGGLHVRQQALPAVAPDLPVPVLGLIKQGVALAVRPGGMDQDLPEVRSCLRRCREGDVSALTQGDGEGLIGGVVVGGGGAVQIGVADVAVFVVLLHPAGQEIRPGPVLREEIILLAARFPGAGVGQLIQHPGTDGGVLRGPGPEGQQKQRHSRVGRIGAVLRQLFGGLGGVGKREAVLLHGDFLHLTVGSGLLPGNLGDLRHRRGGAFPVCRQNGYRQHLHGHDQTQHPTDQTCSLLFHPFVLLFREMFGQFYFAIHCGKAQ